VPERLSDVGRRFAGSLTGTAGTRAEIIFGDAETLGGRYEPDDRPSPTLGPNPRPLPPPATETQLDQLRYELRAAQHELKGDETRLAALHEARQRAIAEWSAASAGVAEAEEMVRAARTHSRGALVQAFLDGEDTNAVMTEADAKTLLAIRREQLQHAQEVSDALRAEIYDIEVNGLKRRRQDCQRAAGRLLSRTPEFLALVQRIYDAYATLRNTRRAIAEVREQLWLDSDLRDLIDNDQHHDGSRWSNYVFDETLIADWRDATAHLLGDADAPLPGAGNDRPDQGEENATNSSRPAALRDTHGRFLPADPTSDPVRRSGPAAPRRRRRTSGRNLSRRSSAQPEKVKTAQPKPTPALIQRPRSPRKSAEEPAPPPE
jgi:hypothetical protein